MTPAFAKAGLLVATLAATVAILMLFSAIAGPLMALRQKSLAHVAKKEADRAQENEKQLRDVVDRMLTRTAEQLKYMPYSGQVRRELLLGALEFYKGFLKQHSSDPDVRYMTALAWRRVGTIQKQLGHGEKSNDAFGRAIEILDRLCAQYPSVTPYRTALAQCYMGPDYWVSDPNNHRIAVNLFEKLVQDHPIDHEFLSLLALAYGKLGHSLQKFDRFDKAEEYFQHAFETWENLADQHTPTVESLLCRSHFHLFYAYMLTNNYRLQEAEDHQRKAILLCETAIQNTPPTLPLMRDLLGAAKGQLGVVLNFAGKTEDAAKSMVDSIEILEGITADPDQVTLRQILGWQWRDLSNAQLAMHHVSDAEDSLLRSLDIVRRLVEKFPDSRDYDNELGTVNYRLGTLYYCTDRRPKARKAFKKARELFEHYVEANPDRARSPRRLIVLLSTCPDLHLRNVDRAVILAQRSVDMGPQHGRYWHLLGVAQCQAGQDQDAVKSLTKSMKLRAGGDSFDRLFLAMAHWQLGQEDLARRSYDDAVDFIDNRNRRLSRDFTPLDLRRFRAQADQLLASPRPRTSDNG